VFLVPGVESPVNPSFENSPRRWIGMALLRIVIPIQVSYWSMILSENRYPLFRIML